MSDGLDESGMMEPMKINGVVSFWLRVGAIAAAALAIVALVTFMHNVAISSVKGELGGISKRLDRLTEAVGLATDAIVESDSLERAGVIRQLRILRRTPLEK